MSSPKIDKVRSAEDRTLPVFAEFDQLMDRIRERAFERFCRRGSLPGHDLEDWLAAECEVYSPATELEEDDDEFELKVALAGFEPEDITVTATPRELIVKASHEYEEKKSDDEKGKVLWSDFRREDVYKRVVLPADVDVGKISAEFKRGLLDIEAPKLKTRAKKKRPKKVKVSSAD